MRVDRRALIAGLFVGVAGGLPSCTSAAHGECGVDCDAQALARDGGPAVPPSTAAATCGNGVLDPGEACDDGSSCADGRSCTSDRYRCDGTSRASCQPRSGDGCSARCTLEPRPACSLDRIDCASGETPAPALPIDTPPPLAPTPAAPDAPDAPDDAGDEPLDARDTASEPPACTLGEFAPPEPIAGLDPSLSVWAPALTPDGQTLYFAASSGSSIEALHVATRVRRARVSESTRLAALDSGTGEGTPFPSFDGLSLYFYSLRAGDGDRDLWRATRSDAGAAFDDARILPSINTFALEHLPWLAADELTLLFVSNREGSQGQSDIWIATRPATNASFGAARPLAGVNSASDEGRAVLSRDGKTSFFTSARDGGQGAYDLWTATRGAVELAFGPVRNLSALNAAGRDMDPFLSANERELWFASDRSGRVTLWRSVRDCTE